MRQQVTTREELVQILDREGAQSGECGHEPGDLDECQCGDCRRILEGYADAILAAGFRRQGPATVSRARVEQIANATLLGTGGRPNQNPWSPVFRRRLEAFVAELGVEVTD